MAFSFPKKAFPLAHLYRTANAALTRAFRHLRDRDAALRRRSGGSWPQQTARNNLAVIIWPRQSSRLFSHFARPYGGNQIKQRTKYYGAHHDPVRGAAVRHRTEIGIRGRSVTRALHCRPNATRQGQK
jgi:hypothetical protein